MFPLSRKRAHPPYNEGMDARPCYHCKQPILPGEAHDCWTTTEQALTRALPEDLRDAWERLRETASAFGEQRIYASHNSIMFSRKACYFFVRPNKKYLELCSFLGRTINGPQIRRAQPTSKTKIAHTLRITHRDEVEPPITDWLREAYDVSDQLASRTPAAGERPLARQAARKRSTAAS